MTQKRKIIEEFMMIKIRGRELKRVWSNVNAVKNGTKRDWERESENEDERNNLKIRKPFHSIHLKKEN